MQQWLEQLAPDVAATFRRFPLATLLAFLGTILAIALANEWVPDVPEHWLRLTAGLFTGAIFASAGTLFGEGRPNARIATLIVAFLLPLLVVGIWQISNTDFIVSPIFPLIGLLWLSISPFTVWGSKETRSDIQNRFWWINHRSITTAIIAGVAFGLISLGFVALERAMAILFGLKTSELFYQYLLPFTGLFLTPVYWLSTIPRLKDYAPSEISEPDFLSRAIGFLGQFILTPFLFIYALILLAYAVQIGITFSLPEGILGWMVLGFTTVGAANWLVLHPEFMHQRSMVKQFRRFWFWLTIVPLVLYTLAVWIRIDTYGLTAERMGLVAGGLWAGLLTLVFLSHKWADIRLIPGFAGVIVLVFSIGPWNFINLPLQHQAMRLDVAIFNATPDTQSTGGPYTWSKESADSTRGAIRYLSQFDAGDVLLDNVLIRNGVDLGTAKPTQLNAVFDALNLERTANNSALTWRHLTSTNSNHVDVSLTPFALGYFHLVGAYWVEVGPLSFEANDGDLLVKGVSGVEQPIDLGDWIEKQGTADIVQPAFEFEYEGELYRLVILEVSLRNSETVSGEWVISDLQAYLFSAKAPGVSDD